jgi:hypothetical protein
VLVFQGLLNQAAQEEHIWHPHCTVLNMSQYRISYQARAEGCRRRAAEATWPPDKLSWTELAQAWLRLAQSADVSEPADAQSPLLGFQSRRCKVAARSKSRVALESYAQPQRRGGFFRRLFGGP